MTLDEQWLSTPWYDQPAGSTFVSARPSHLIMMIGEGRALRLFMNSLEIITTTSLTPSQQGWRKKDHIAQGS